MRLPLPTACFFLLLACGGPPNNARRTDTSRYGGVFNFNVAQPLRSLFPLSITQVSEIHVASQIYEGLARLDPLDLSVRPALAESWIVDADRTTYTFLLRKGVRFQDDPAFDGGEGREVTASDVAACFTAICRSSLAGQVGKIFRDRIVGASDLHDDSPVAGIQVVDKHTLQIVLKGPYADFPQVLTDPACWIYPHELVDAYGGDLLRHAIGTGPFKIKAMVPDEAVVLQRNAHYWGRDAKGNPLPYLDGVRVTMVPDKDKELGAFLKGNLNMLTGLTLEGKAKLDAVLGGQAGHRRFATMSVPEMATQYYGFNVHKPPFNDARVRLAFALAINKVFLVDSVLDGTAVEAAHGLVPPGLSGYPYQDVPGIPFDPDSARKLLASAGYPNGKGFPKVHLQVNNDGFGYRQVAVAVQDMLWKELHVPISVSVVPPKEYYARIEKGESRFWREGWVADRPDAANFLALLYGGAPVTDSSSVPLLNTTRYRNAQFDGLFGAAMAESDATARMRDLARAERTALHDVPLIPLYHPRHIILCQPGVRGLRANAMEALDLREVWLDRAQDTADSVPSSS